MTIPEIRKRLYELAEEHGIAELAVLADASYRRTYTRTPAKRRNLTPDLVASIRAYVAANPEVAVQDVASKFYVNPGRVSEAMHGRREAGQ